MTYAFTHMGNFLLLLLLLLGIWAGIWTSRLRFGPQDWDMRLEATVWASKLGFEGDGGGEEEEEEGEGEEEEGGGGENHPYV